MAISSKLKSQNNRGPGYWKLNHSYDEQCFDLICQTIDSCNDLTIESAQIKWEICKIEIKSKTIEFAKLKSRERHNKLNQLEKKLQHLHSLPNDSINHNEINDLETEIMQQYEFESKGLEFSFLRREKKNHFSFFFTNLEKSRQYRRLISSLKLNGQTVTIDDLILKEIAQYYKRLYTASSEETDHDTY